MPEVSVIVCTYNRATYIKRTLTCLKEQTISPEKFEVLIIDNNSKDATPKICNQFIKELNQNNLNYFLEMNQGHTYARNRGIKESKGNILAFIDDDAFVYPDYIVQIINCFKINPEAIAAGGKIIPVYEAGQPPKWMSKYLLPLVAALDLGEKIKPFKNGKFPIGANMAFRKEVFEKYGLFDVSLGRRGTEGLEGGDEKDVFHRLAKDNQIILYDPSIKVDHIIPEKRVQLSYVKGLAIGVGTSERKRLGGVGKSALLLKWWSELVKVGGTIILFFFYLFQLRIHASIMLIRFRYWVIKGLIK